MTPVNKKEASLKERFPGNKSIKKSYKTMISLSLFLSIEQVSRKKILKVEWARIALIFLLFDQSSLLLIDRQTFT